MRAVFDAAMSQLGQFLLRYLTESAAALPHKAAASAIPHGGSYGPISAARTRSKSSEPFRRRPMVKLPGLSPERRSNHRLNNAASHPAPLS